MSNLHSPHHSPHRINCISFRGGGDNDEDVELGDDDDKDINKVHLDFIASFESELADIRRDVEMEAENEMNKLLGLFAVEHREEVEDETEMESEYYDSISFDEDDENIDSSNNGVSLEETLNILPSSVSSESYYESENESDQEDALPDNDETIISELMMKNDSKDEPDNKAITDTTTEPAGLTTYAGESRDTQIVDFTTIAEKKVSARTKPKTNKRKTKASKKGKTKIKARQDYDDVVIELSDDLEESQTGGIWGFLQSDLGRVLKLFIPTMILAIITTRMQRRMDDADKLAAAVKAVAVASDMD
jgi:hypothetical protein